MVPGFRFQVTGMQTRNPSRSLRGELFRFRVSRFGFQVLCLQDPVMVFSRDLQLNPCIFGWHKIFSSLVSYTPKRKYSLFVCCACHPLYKNCTDNSGSGTRCRQAPGMGGQNSKRIILDISTHTTSTIATYLSLPRLESYYIR